MEPDLAYSGILQEAGATADMIAQYQRYQDAGNKSGQERLLLACRRMQNEKLKTDREKLACLDFIIARVEKTGDIFRCDV